MNSEEIILLVINLFALINLIIVLFFQIKRKSIDKDFLNILETHLNLISYLQGRVNELEKRIKELEKKNKKENVRKTTLRNVSSK